ncbi:MAG: SPFH/Band 7/PHB domain protein [Sediminibacterium sp.]|nr:SPFH/Band 7/PHB domain protein [Sediminibacterium sp.]
MSITVIIILILALFLIITVIRSIKIIKQSETMVIERLGRYNRTLNSGIHIIVPLIDQTRKISWRYLVEFERSKTVSIKQEVSRIDLRENVYDFPKQNVITKDNVVTEVNAILYFQITDPIKAIYEIANLPDAIEKLTQTTLRNVIGEMDLDETLTSRDTINSKLRNVLDEASHKWGVKVNRIELQDINPPHDIRDAMEKQMRAERSKRAQILEAEGKKMQLTLEAEGEKIAVINRAEGAKQSRILQAEGEAEARLCVADAEAKAISAVNVSLQNGNINPAQYLIAMRYIEALKEMVSGKDNKMIYMPYEATAVLSSLGGIKELFNSNAIKS